MSNPWIDADMDIFEINKEIAEPMMFYSTVYNELVREYVTTTKYPTVPFADWKPGEFYMLTGTWLYFLKTDGSAWGIAMTTIGKNHLLVKEALENGISMDDLVSILQL